MLQKNENYRYNAWSIAYLNSKALINDSLNAYCSQVSIIGKKSFEDTYFLILDEFHVSFSGD